MFDFRKNTRKKYSQTSEIKYPSISMKQRFAKVKKLQNSMKSLCDNDSSSLEDVRPFFLKSNSCKLNTKKFVYRKKLEKIFKIKKYCFKIIFR